MNNKVKQGSNRQEAFRKARAYIRKVRVSLNELKKIFNQDAETLKNSGYNMPAIFYHIGSIHNDYQIVYNILEIGQDTPHYKDIKAKALPFCRKIEDYLNEIEEKVIDDSEKDYDKYIPLIFMNMGKLESWFETMLIIMGIEEITE